MEVLFLLEPTVYSTKMKSCVSAFVTVYAHTALYTYTHTDMYRYIPVCVCIHTRMCIPQSITNVIIDLTQILGKYILI